MHIRLDHLTLALFVIAASFGCGEPQPLTDNADIRADDDPADTGRGDSDAEHTDDGGDVAAADVGGDTDADLGIDLPEDVAGDDDAPSDVGGHDATDESDADVADTTPVPDVPGCEVEPEVCDGLDNDCDGAIDEDLPPLVCGAGQCAVTMEACAEGAPLSCPEGPPAVAPCNGLEPSFDREYLDGGLQLDELDRPWPGQVACTDEQTERFFNSNDDRLELTCSLTFPPGAELRKNLRLNGEDASNITVDCNGGSIVPVDPDDWTIRIRSVERGGRWSRPRNIRFVDCLIEGSVRIFGLGRNGESRGVRESSYEAGHTERAQEIAPTNILFHRVTIEGTGTIPLYVAPGATRVKLIDSRLEGWSTSTAIYLDAESAYNVIQNNELFTETGWDREVLAVDGSAHNLIAGNHFSSLHRGGIYVYRNCGEGGTVRHQTPRGNKIINNYFDFSSSNGALNPAIWLGTREGLRLYCNDDDGYPFGSSVNNLDFADLNLVLDNQVLTQPVADKIWDNGDGNVLAGNETVSSRSSRPSSCAFFDTCDFNVEPEGACFEWDGGHFLCRDGHFLEQ